MPTRTCARSPVGLSSCGPSPSARKGGRDIAHHRLCTAIVVAFLAGCAIAPHDTPAREPLRTAIFGGDYLDLAACSHGRLEEIAGHRRVELVDLGTRASVVVRSASEASLAAAVYELTFTPSGDRVAVAMLGAKGGSDADIALVWREVETCARLGKW